jgi:hypothetical protein
MPPHGKSAPPNYKWSSQFEQEEVDFKQFVIDADDITQRRQSNSIDG